MYQQTTEDVGLYFIVHHFLQGWKGVAYSHKSWNVKNWRLWELDFVPKVNKKYKKLWIKIIKKEKKESKVDC